MPRVEREVTGDQTFKPISLGDREKETAKSKLVLYDNQQSGGI